MLLVEEVVRANKVNQLHRDACGVGGGVLWGGVDGGV